MFRNKFFIALFVLIAGSSLCAAVYEEPIIIGDDASYDNAVSKIFSGYVFDSKTPITPGPRGKVGIKIYTRSGPGLRTPPALVRGVIHQLMQRGFSKENIIIVDESAHRLRMSEYLPPLSVGGSTFEGVSVNSLDSGEHWDPDWYYESALPSRDHFTYFFSRWFLSQEKRIEERKSYLPVVLLLDVDFWINLPMVTTSQALGVSGAVANATLLNISNNSRFLSSQTTGPVAAAEIAAIPEMQSTWVLNIVSLERYQYVADYQFMAGYTASEPLLLWSSDAADIDKSLLKRINDARIERGFSPIDEDLAIFRYLESLGVN